MKRNIGKSTAAVLLVLACLLSFLPTAVSAADEFAAYTGVKNYLKTTGDSFTLEVFPKNGTEPYTYSWEYTSYTGTDWTALTAGDVYGGVNEKILTFTKAPAGLKMRVHCLVTDANGKKAISDECFVTVRDTYSAPELYYIGVEGAGALKENTYSLYKGATINLFCNAATTGEVILYQWQYTDGTTKTVNVFGGGTKEVKVWNNIAGGTSYNLFNPLDPLRAGDEVKGVRVRLTDTNGTVTSDEIVINTIGTVRRVADPENVSIRTGDTATFKAEFEGAVDYKWAYIPKDGEKASYINSSFAATYGVSILGETGTTLTLSNIKDTALNGFRFYCCGYDSAGSIVTTKTATLTVTKKAEETKPDTGEGGGKDDGKTDEKPNTGLPFTDVSENAWYLKDVKNAYNEGLINGKTATEYCPDENMTIAEAIKLAACMHQQYYKGKVTLTADGTPWYQNYVDYAKENGITDKTYADYNKAVTREEYVHIFFGALPQKEYTQFNLVLYGDIPDVSESHEYALEIYTFYRAGILAGMDEYGTFEPKSNIKRSEVAAILTRMTDDNTRKSVILKKKK